MKTTAVKFLNLSDLNLSPAAHEDLVNGPFSFGDLDMALVRLDRMQTEVDWSNPADLDRLNDVFISTFGSSVYVNLEG